MGLRRWLGRQAQRPGIKDPSRGAQAYPIDQQRDWIINTIDDSPFQVWVVIVAGMGFLTDAYDIFALNVVIPMLGFVYWPETGKVPEGYQVGFLCATLAGTMLGNVIFGIAADIVGRRKMYGTELLVVILATLLLSMSSRGEKDSLQVVGFILAWRLMMGICIGADYPLSAVITAEFAPRKHRARMMAWVFFMQPIGQLLANVVSLVIVVSWQSRITSDHTTCQNDDCIRTVDRIWRLVVGLGTVPAVISLAFRFTIPESPRYKIDIKRKVTKAYDDTGDFYGGSHDPEEGQALTDMNQKSVGSFDQRDSSPPPPRSPQRLLVESESYAHSQHLRPLSSEIAPEDQISNDGDTYIPDRERASTMVIAEATSTEFNQPPMASRSDIKKFFIKEGNWCYLLGTSLSWLCLDFAFYGLGLSSPTIVRHIWSPNDPTPAVYQALRDNSTHSLIMVSIGAIVGGAAMIKIIKYVSPKTLQFWGFIVLAVLFVVIGSAWTPLLKNGNQTGLIILYVLCQLVFNLGPNVTTFIIPAEIFPTRYRCACHGISAAAGKLGSWVAQLFIMYAFRGADEDKTWLGHVLQVLAAFMVAGALTTYFLVPETRDHKGKSRTLEELAEGRIKLRELNRRRRESDD
ncbi:MFS general substrate transporter [Lepidopterella palustris CBS 459.81]|uniref:MFS general substrate transporter n=1 Tax=Lepidopterella palustris CBS 459.81 TaxID=1314670 RepID=A0A8E2JGY0_9PEZI|nr:MFS general substrate transporter [Lepidopterella palustris CBS 459.81]